MKETSCTLYTTQTNQSAAMRCDSTFLGTRYSIVLLVLFVFISINSSTKQNYFTYDDVLLLLGHGPPR